MINSQLLFDVIRYNHFSLADMAYILNVDEKEFKKNLRHGVFPSNQLEMMLHVLHFPVNPMKIFFDSYDYDDPKKIEWLEPMRESKKRKRNLEKVIHHP